MVTVTVVFTFPFYDLSQAPPQLAEASHYIAWHSITWPQLHHRFFHSNALGPLAGAAAAGQGVARGALSHALALALDAV